jgi:hypothetical protein
VGEHGVILPPPLPLTSERLERHGLFLIEDGQNIFLWVGRDSVPQLVIDVFNLPSYEVLRGGKVVPILEQSIGLCAQPIHRLRYPFSKTPSPKGSTLSSRRPARCDVGYTIPMFTSSRRTARHRFVCGH